MTNFVTLAFIIAEISTFEQIDRQTDGYGLIDSVSDPNLNLIYFVESATPSSVCYIQSWYTLFVNF